MTAQSMAWHPYMPERLSWREIARGNIGSANGLFEPQAEAVVAIGAFDGLHLGHRALIEAACQSARKLDMPCVAVMFDPDPAEFLSGKDASSNSRLLHCADRAAGLVSLGADAVVSLRFDESISGISPRAFVDDVLPDVVRPRMLHVGENFRFGCGGQGDVTTLASLAKEAGFEVRVHPLVCRDASRVSSTRIRSLLREGSLDDANELLGRCHYVRGVVEHGRGEGTGFGFPTANVCCEREDCVPTEGVYAAYVSCDGRAWPAAVNVGSPPTFAQRREAFMEANLLGFSGDLYGREVCVSFVKWLRASRRFDTIDELERTVRGNISWVSENLGSHELEVSL